MLFIGAVCIIYVFPGTLQNKHIVSQHEIYQGRHYCKGPQGPIGCAKQPKFIEKNIIANSDTGLFSVCVAF